MIIIRIIQATIIMMAIDFIGFIAWWISGQAPVDDFFIGTLTLHFIQLFIS